MADQSGIVPGPDEGGGNIQRIYYEIKEVADSTCTMGLKIYTNIGDTFIIELPHGMGHNNVKTTPVWATLCETTYDKWTVGDFQVHLMHVGDPEQNTYRLDATDTIIKLHVVPLAIGVATGYYLLRCGRTHTVSR